MTLQSLNLRRGGGQYYQGGQWPVFIEKIDAGWLLSATVPGWREAYLVDARQDRMWLKRMQNSRTLLSQAKLAGYAFSTRREALQAWDFACQMASPS